MDPISIVSGFTAGKTLLSLFKTFSDSLKDLGKTEVVSQLVDIQSAMLDLLEKYNYLIEENRGLREKVKELDESLKIKNSLEFHYKSYWIKKNDEQYDGPFSQMFWDKEKQLVRLIEYEKIEEGDHYKERMIYKCRETRETVAVPIEFIEKYKITTYDHDEIPLHK